MRWPTIILCVFSHVLVSAQGPEESAVEFLESIQVGNIDLETGAQTAISANTTSEKTSEIKKRLTRLRQDLKPGGFQVASSRVQDNHAAFILYQSSFLDASQLQTFPVGLVRHKGIWLPAPVLGSFENSINRLNRNNLKTTKALEDWMAEERVIQKIAINADIEGQRRKLIQASIEVESLEEDNLGDIAKAFIAACQNRDEAKILAYLGGLNDPFPSDWASRLGAAQQACRLDLDAKDPWQLIRSKDALQVVFNIESEQTSGRVSLGCFHPNQSNAVLVVDNFEILNVDFVKDDSGRWFISLPPKLMAPSDFKDATKISEDEKTRAWALLKTLPSLFRKEVPQEFFKTHLGLEETFIDSLKTKPFPEMLAYIHFPEKRIDALKEILSTGRQWKAMRSAARGSIVSRVASKATEDMTLSVYLVFDPERPSTPLFWKFFCKKDPSGWSLALDIYDDAKNRQSIQLLSWYEKNEALWKEGWQEHLLADAVLLEKFVDDQITDHTSLNLIDSYLNLLEKNELADAIGKVAYLKKEKHSESDFLAILKNELIDAKNLDRTKIKITQKNGLTLGIIPMKDPLKDPRQRLILVVQTLEGPRIVPEIDLFTNGSRTREFLNVAALDRLTIFAGEDLVANLKEILSAQ